MSAKRRVALFVMVGICLLGPCRIGAALANPLLQSGARGEEVAALQGELAAAGYGPGATDGIFGQDTRSAVEAFQRSRGLIADGVVGTATWVDLASAAGAGAVLREGARGTAVMSMQERLYRLGFLSGPVDGVFGPATSGGLQAFQRWAGLVADGVFGPATKAALGTEVASRSYMVRPGDNLAAIAARFGVTVGSISQADGLTDPNLLRAGEMLTIPVIATPAAASVTPPPAAESSTPASASPQVFGGVVLGKLIPPEAIGTGATVSVPKPKPQKSGPARWKLALTFDGGPDLKWTPRILAELKHERMVATFFLSGQDVAAHPAMVKEIAAAGNLVEVRSYNRESLCRLSAVQVGAQLARTVELVRKLTGRIPRFFRPPGGCFNAAVIKEAGRVGLSLLLWNNVGGQDLAITDPGLLARRVLGFARPGMVLMLNVTKPVVAEALPAILKTLVADGYGLVTVDGMVR